MINYVIKISGILIMGEGGILALLAMTTSDLIGWDTLILFLLGAGATAIGFMSTTKSSIKTMRSDIAENKAKAKDNSERMDKVELEIALLKKAYEKIGDDIKHHMDMTSQKIDGALNAAHESKRRYDDNLESIRKDMGKIEKDIHELWERNK